MGEEKYRLPAWYQLSAPIDCAHEVRRIYQWKLFPDALASGRQTFESVDRA